LEEPNMCRSQWFDEECTKILRKQNITRLQISNNYTRKRREEYNRSRKDSNKRKGNTGQRG